MCWLSKTGENNVLYLEEKEEGIQRQSIKITCTEICKMVVRKRWLFNIINWPVLSSSTWYLCNPHIPKTWHLRWANFFLEEAGLFQLTPKERMNAHLGSSHLSSTSGCLCWQQESQIASGKMQKVTGSCGIASSKESLLPAAIICILYPKTQTFYSFQTFLLKKKQCDISELSSHFLLLHDKNKEQYKCYLGRNTRNIWGGTVSGTSTCCEPPS